MSAQYYIDGTTLANSTAIYSDAALTQCAPQGHYSDGVNTRYQVLTATGCYLQALQPCPSCAEPCGGSINGSGGEGIYIIDLDVGGTTSDVGAIVVFMNPASVPDGVLVEYNGVTYNKGVRATGTAGSTDLGGGTSNSGGLAQGSSGNYTMVGVNLSGCGLTTFPKTSDFDVYNYVGGSFVASGTTETATITNADLVLQPQGTGGVPGNFVIVVPKPYAAPNTIRIKIIGPCGGTGWSAGVTCPTLLTQFSSQLTPLSASNEACSRQRNDSLYCVSTSTRAATQTPQVRDQVFEDAYGLVSVTDGWRSYQDPNNPADFYRYETNQGVVITLELCTS